MDFFQKLGPHSTKQSTKEITEYVLTYPTTMDHLMDVYFSEEWRYCQRAANPLVDLAKKKPSLLLPFLAKMLAQSKKTKHPSMVRNSLRIMQFVEIPEGLAGELFDYCYSFVHDTSAPTGYRAFSATILTNLTDQYDDLTSEIITLLEEVGQHGSVGFTHRVERLLKHLRSKK